MGNIRQMAALNNVDVIGDTYRHRLEMSAVYRQRNITPFVRGACQNYVGQTLSPHKVEISEPIAK